ncbi:hypothetical protein AAVH_01093 [Aphelenchoides avenae]|nr:hypothetical protein AAVH_01093 [Aphelenchus avenae]
MVLHSRIRRDTETDSGIDSIARSAMPSRCSYAGESDGYEAPLRLVEGKRRVQVDDVLWYCCFVMTMFFFDIPNSLITHWKVDWAYLRLSVLASVALITLAIYLRAVAHYKRQLANRQLPYLRGLAFGLFLIIATCFCLATWRLYSGWSIFICFVTTMTFISLTSVI